MTTGWRIASVRQGALIKIIRQGIEPSHGLVQTYVAPQRTDEPIKVMIGTIINVGLRVIHACIVYNSAGPVKRFSFRPLKLYKVFGNTTKLRAALQIEKW